VCVRFFRAIIAFYSIGFRILVLGFWVIIAFYGINPDIGFYFRIIIAFEGIDSGV
jgi:hypothetical protein